MAEIFLSDFFAENGGAADDSADCTASFNAAFAALVASGGGVVRLPSGICRIAGKVLSNAWGPVSIVGCGDSVIRFVGNADRRMELNAQDHLLSVENVTFIGKTSNSSPRTPDNFNATDMFIMAKAKIASFTNCRFLGLATQSGRGLVVINNSAGVFDKCQFDASAAGTTGGAIAGYMVTSIAVTDCNFIDHCIYQGIDYSKTILGNRGWITLTSWQPEGAANYPRLLDVNRCTFDEGCVDAIYVDGADLVSIKRSGINKSFYGVGINIKNTRDVRISQLFNGYRIEPNHKGMTLENVEFARLEGLRHHNGVCYIEFTGTTKRVILENCYLQGNEEYPNGIRNSANALLEIDGVKYRNGMIAY